MTDMTAIYREDATFEEVVAAYQRLINTGDAWRLEGGVGRLAMSFIEEGVCALGESEHTDYWGNRIPSRVQVEPGTKGSVQYVHDHGNEVIE